MRKVEVDKATRIIAIDNYIDTKTSLHQRILNSEGLIELSRIPKTVLKFSVTVETDYFGR